MSLESRLPENLNALANNASPKKAQSPAGARLNDALGEEFSKAVEEFVKRQQWPVEDLEIQRSKSAGDAQGVEIKGGPGVEGRSGPDFAIRGRMIDANERFSGTVDVETAALRAAANFPIPQAQSHPGSIFPVPLKTLEPKLEMSLTMPSPPVRAEESSHASTALLATGDAASPAGHARNALPEVASALGELLEHHFLPSNRKGVTGWQDSNSAVLEIHVRRQEKHMPTLPLWGLDKRGAFEPWSLQSPEPEPPIADRPLVVGNAPKRVAGSAFAPLHDSAPAPAPLQSQASAPGQASASASAPVPALLQASAPVRAPRDEMTEDIKSVRMEDSPIALESNSGVDGFAQQLTKRIAREVAPLAPPAAPAAPSKVATLQPSSPIGGNVVRILEVGLQPASLGALTVRLSLRGQELSVSLSADTQSALDAINNERDSIEAALKNAGYTLDELKVHRTDLEQVRNQPDQQLRGDATGRNTTGGRGDGNADTTGSGRERDDSKDTAGHSNNTAKTEPVEPGMLAGTRNPRSVVV
ncbi:MAG: hypothetical protein APF80_01710 [Alphaproteobacteria bacterium BRH_c36]|nr:MAG: hypothetical protein APF80_01710 [Alphaproteobacteria bacterium BRH_c36]